MTLPYGNLKSLLKREGAFSGAWAGTEVMNLQGVINKSGILMLLCLGSAAFSWTHPELRMVLVLVGLIGGFIAWLVGTFKPTTSPVAAPAYAVLEGWLWEPSPRFSNFAIQESWSTRCC